jgi:hypothetical protein
VTGQVAPDLRASAAVVQSFANSPAGLEDVSCREEMLPEVALTGTACWHWATSKGRSWRWVLKKESTCRVACCRSDGLARGGHVFINVHHPGCKARVLRPP